MGGRPRRHHEQRRAHAKKLQATQKRYSQVNKQLQNLKKQLANGKTPAPKKKSVERRMEEMRGKVADMKQEVAQLKKAAPPAPNYAMGVADAAAPKDCAVRLRGDPKTASRRCASGSNRRGGRSGLPRHAGHRRRMTLNGSRGCGARLG